MTRIPHLSSISVVIVIESAICQIDEMLQLENFLTTYANDYEIIIVANGVESDITDILTFYIKKINFLTVLFLPATIDEKEAILIGIDNSIGDWVLVKNHVSHNLDSLEIMLKYTDSYSVIFLGPEKSNRPNILSKINSKVMGREYVSTDPTIRLYSRASARYLASLVDGALVMNSISFCGSFPGIWINDGESKSHASEKYVNKSGVLSIVRMLVSARAMPLRLVVLIALFGSVVSIFSSIYAILSYLLRNNIAPGWTTLSLQISFAVFVNSLLLSLIAGYVLNLYRSMHPKRRVPIIRELRSNISSDFYNRLNVINGDASINLGAPADFPPISQDEDQT